MFYISLAIFFYIFPTKGFGDPIREGLSQMFFLDLFFYCLFVTKQIIVRRKIKGDFSNERFGTRLRGDSEDAGAEQGLGHVA